MAAIRPETAGFYTPRALILAAVFFSGFASAGLLVLKPLLVGALIDDYHYTAPLAGYVAGIEMAGIGISSLLFATMGRAWNRRLVIVIGASLGILGSIAPVVSALYVPLLLSRLMAGIGCGLISAVVLSVIGTNRNPDRTFSLYYLIAFGGSALLVPVGVWAISRFLVAGGYILLAVLLVFVYLAANSFPSVVRHEANGHMHMSHSAIRTMPALWCLGLSLFYWIGFGGVWAFVERLGIRANLSHAEIGSVLSLGPLASIAGAICASILHTRLGRSPILLLSIALEMMSVVMLGWVTSRLSFVAAVLALSYVWPLFLAYLGGTMAAIDPSGRIVAMSVTSQTLGMAIGPAAAGVAAGYFGYVGIAAMALICCTIALICLGLMVGSRR